uniref:Fibrinogen C-terminal domain-containing protein n=1 Tax=Anopheles farauti TaxID=69004 RepID=A0A182R0M9_9DIPT
MRSVPLVRLLPICGLLLAVQFRTSVAEVSGFGFELLLARLEAFESQMNAWMDQLSQNGTAKLTEYSGQLKTMAKSVESRIKMLEKSTAKDFKTLRANIKQSDHRMKTSDSKRKELSEHLEQRLEELTVRSGVYIAKYATFEHAFRVYREGPQYHGYGGSWTVVQRRFDGSVDFNRSFVDYRDGFGDLDGEYWMGLDKLYRILLSERHELLIELEDFDGVIVYAKYDDFQLANVDESYKIKSVGQYAGTAGDSLTHHHIGKKFATYDRCDDNSCAKVFGGGGWFGACFHMHLNGGYRERKHHQTYGISWQTYKDKHSFKASKMMVRPYAFKGGF